MKFGISVLMLALLLSSCASPQELRGKIADLDQVTSISAEWLAGCIGDKFESFTGGDRNVRYYTRPTSNGFSIAGESHIAGLYGSATDTPVLVDVTKLGDGNTHVQLWSNFPFPSGDKKYGGTGEVLSLLMIDVAGSAANRKLR